MDDMIITAMVAGNAVLSLAILYIVAPLSRLQGRFELLHEMVTGHEKRIHAIEGR